MLCDEGAASYSLGGRRRDSQRLLRAPYFIWVSVVSVPSALCHMQINVPVLRLNRTVVWSFVIFYLGTFTADMYTEQELDQRTDSRLNKK